ncbi:MULTISPECIES: thiamine phosphate synthase [unclassified Sphingomonas]|uniref:thiamine phosphate synthase n=1 Tax=unclassified Sphingomonas TaxID=196159 RepID=UPI000BD8CEE2|nr:MAG: thiamine phosphate synthase [Sphingomonas sp. 32-62-10]
MRARHPRIPTQWLMTDERMGEGLWDALNRLPRGGGVIFRHYTLAHHDRRTLYDRVARIARRRGLVLLVAGAHQLGKRDAGRHGRIGQQIKGLKSWPAHNRAEVIAGVRAGADLILISPIFPTRSHPGERALGMIRAAMLARGMPLPVIALGGIHHGNFRRTKAAGFCGWAAIDAWVATRDCKKLELNPRD